MRQQPTRVGASTQGTCERALYWRPVFQDSRDGGAGQPIPLWRPLRSPPPCGTPGGKMSQFSRRFGGGAAGRGLRGERCQGSPPWQESSPWRPAQLRRERRIAVTEATSVSGDVQRQVALRSPCAGSRSRRRDDGHPCDRIPVRVSGSVARAPARRLRRAPRPAPRARSPSTASAAACRVRSGPGLGSKRPTRPD